MWLKLLSILSDDDFHSEESLSNALAVNHISVRRQLLSLSRCWGVKLHSVAGKGYKLAEPLELLDRDYIMDGIDPNLQRLCSSVEIFSEVDSTNSYLISRIRKNTVGPGTVCMAEFQSAGRGRRGRQWISPFASSICLSLYWRFSMSSTELSGLSLAMAVAVAESLQLAGLSGVTVKWPNDILWEGKKIAGILLESSGNGYGFNDVVIGVGLNIRMPSHASDKIGQEWVDLESALGKTVSRNRVAAILLQKLLETALLYQGSGLAVFLKRWRSMDTMCNCDAVLNVYGKYVYGVSRGVDENGALVFESDGKICSYQSGEVSLRRPSV